MALGGIGEIGMNCYLYGLGPADDRRWLMVDLGITFPEGENDPGVDVILPDLRYIEAERKQPRGPRADARARGPLGGRHRAVAPAQGADLRHAVHGGTAQEPRWPSSASGVELPINEVALNSRFDVGPFAIELIEMAHSIPESSALVLRTPFGPVFHTGDWKLDPTPVLGAPVDTSRLARLGATRASLPPSAIPPTPCAKAARRRSATWPGRWPRSSARRSGAWPSPSSPPTSPASAPLATPRVSPGGGWWSPGRAMHRVIEVAMATGYLPADFKYDDQSRFSDLPAERGAGPVHRQPGRAARRACPHRRRRAPRRRARPGRPRDLLLAHHPGQRARGRPDPEPARRSRLRDHHRRGRARARHRPSAPRGAEARCTPRSGRASPSPCTARRGI